MRFSQLTTKNVQKRSFLALKMSEGSKICSITRDLLPNSEFSRYQDAPSNNQCQTSISIWPNNSLVISLTNLPGSLQLKEEAYVNRSKLKIADLFFFFCICKYLNLHKA
jgi:hypothetical protein